MKSIADKSLTSSIATSRETSFFLNATMLCPRAIGSGMSDKISKGIFFAFKSTKGMPSTYACMRRRLSAVIFPWVTRVSPSLLFFLSASFFAASRSSFETSPESRMNLYSWVSSMSIMPYILPDNRLGCLMLRFFALRFSGISLPSSFIAWRILEPTLK